MQSDLGALQITAQEIEDFVDLSPSNTLALDAYRAFILKRPKQILSVLLTELFALGLLLTFGNVYLWKQCQKVKSLARLMDEVDKYNGVIQAITLVDELELVGNSTTQLNHLSNRQEVVEALKVTKESLISALRVQRILRRHKSFIGSRYELLANLENNLNTLMSFEVSNHASEYGRLLNESLQIGMSVHKEVRKLQNHSF
jgi:hypothetical protein